MTYVSIVPMNEADLEWVRLMRNHETSGSYQVWPLSEADQAAWWERARIDPTQKRFIIRSIPEGHRVGTIALTHIDLQDGCAELGIRVAKEHWRKGYASAAVHMLSDWCFNEARIHRLYSEVFSCNPASIALFRKMGWHEWGVKQAAHLQGGQWHDVICFEVLETMKAGVNG